MTFVKKSNILKVILSGPSGVGKTTVVNGLVERVQYVYQAKTATTRKDRNDKTNYIHMSEEEFDRRERAKQFIETITYDGYKYGTLESEISDNTHTIFIINVNGGIFFSKKYINTVLIFIDASDEIIKQRLSARGETNIKERMSYISSEREAANKYYDYIIYNNKYVSTCVLNILDIIKSEQHRIVR